MKNPFSSFRPREAIFPYHRLQNLHYAEQMPDEIRTWCYLVLLFNIAALVLGTISARNIAPFILFLIFTLQGPVNYSWNWKSQVRAMNSIVDRINALNAVVAGTSAAPVIVSKNIPGLIWVWIAALILTSLVFAIMIIIVLGADLPIIGW